MDRWRWRCTAPTCDGVGGRGTFAEIVTAGVDHVLDVQHAVSFLVQENLETPLPNRVITAIIRSITAILPTIAPLATPEDIKLVADEVTEAATDALLQQKG